METLRTFIAFPISDELRKELGKVQDRIGGNIPNLRPVKPQGIHMTLSFLGEIEQNLVYKIGEAMEQLCNRHKPMHFICKGVGAFPDLKNPRVLWAGVEGDLDKLDAFYQDLCDVLDVLGFPKEGREFNPHLTLFRLKGQKQLGALRKRISEFDNKELGTITCDTLVLYRSDLNPSGAVYTKLKMAALD